MTQDSPPRRLRVRAPSGATEVVVGGGTLAEIDRFLRDAFPRAARFLHVVDAGLLAPGLVERWGQGFLPPKEAVVVPAGEAAKTREVHARLEDAILDAGLTRDDAVIVVGGGAALDVAGYAAATARRGVPWAAVPTTVVAQVDASIGGKTAVNHPRGKNLLGVIHPPALVVVDPRALRTLPARDRVAGLAEAYKAGVAGDPALLVLLRAPPHPEDDEGWADVALRSLMVKARLVEEDERDVGRRRLLNYGHTVGHAIETVLGNEAVRHGEAVAIGMGVAAFVATVRGLVPSGAMKEQDAALSALGLPLRVPSAAPEAALLETIGRDKKRRAGERHTMVLPTADGLAVFEDVTPAELANGIEARRAAAAGDVARKRGAEGTS